MEQSEQEGLKLSYLILVDLWQRHREKGALKVDGVSATAAEEAGSQCSYLQLILSSEKWQSTEMISFCYHLWIQATERDEVRITETAQAEERQSVLGNVSLVFFHDLTRLGFSPSEAWERYQGATQAVGSEVRTLHSIILKNTSASGSWSMP